MNEIKILVVEDEPLILEELSDTLEDLGYTVVGRVMDGETALDAIKHVDPDVIFLDINLEGEMSGIDVGATLLKTGGPPFIYLTSYGDRKTITEATLTQPLGYLIKPFTEQTLLSAIEVGMHNHSKRVVPKSLNREVINSKILNQLTEKEFEIVESIFRGSANEQIAKTQFISKNTVKTHIKNIYTKLDVHNRTALLARLRDLM